MSEAYKCDCCNNFFEDFSWKNEELEVTLCNSCSNIIQDLRMKLVKVLRKRLESELTRYGAAAIAQVRLVDLISDFEQINPEAFIRLFGDYGKGLITVAIQKIG